MGLDDPDVEALARQQTGGGGTDHAGADDGDITVLHSGFPEKGVAPDKDRGAKPNGGMIPQGGAINSETGGELPCQIRGKARAGGRTGPTGGLDIR
ncbi:hypothetical protein D3C78_1357650 [compost metagenome]